MEARILVTKPSGVSREWGAESRRGAPAPPFHTGRAGTLQWPECSACRFLLSPLQASLLSLFFLGFSGYLEPQSKALSTSWIVTPMVTVTWAVFHCFPGCMSRELDWKWSSQDWALGLAGCGLTCSATTQGWLCLPHIQQTLLSHLLHLIKLVNFSCVIFPITPEAGFSPFTKEKQRYREARPGLHSQ